MTKKDYEPKLPTGESMDDFARVLWKFRILSLEGGHVIKSATKNDERKADPILMFVLSNQALILVCKFLEIWNLFNSFAKDNPKVKEFAKMVKPTLERITKVWPKLRDYRNWILAHPYSGNDGVKIVPPWKLLEAEIAPMGAAEIFLLLDCVRFIIASCLVTFSETYNSIKPTFDYGNQPEITKGAQNGEQAESERQKIAQELNVALEKFGIDMKSAIFSELS